MTIKWGSTKMETMYELIRAQTTAMAMGETNSPVCPGKMTIGKKAMIVVSVLISKGLATHEVLCLIVFIFSGAVFAVCINSFETMIELSTIRPSETMTPTRLISLISIPIRKNNPVMNTIFNNMAKPIARLDFRPKVRATTAMTIANP